MSGRGGAHPGAGRKQGGKNKATIERELRAAAGLEAAKAGLMPLDVLLARMRGETLPNGHEPTDAQVAAARDAAPYLHPRLATQTLKGDADHPLHHLHSISDIDARIRELLRKGRGDG